MSSLAVIFSGLRNLRWKRQFALCAAATLLGQCGVGPDRSGDAETTANFNLKGRWEMRVLDFSGSAAPAADARWGTLAVPFDLGRTAEYARLVGCVQLRRPLPDALVRFGQERPLALDSGQTSGAARFYLNDPERGLIGGFGSEPGLSGAPVTEYVTGHDGRLVRVLPTQAFVPGSNYLYAEICTRPGLPLFWRGAKIALAPADQVFDRYLRELAVAFLLAGLYFSIGLYHLLLAVRRPEEIFNLYFGVFATAVALFHLANSAGAELLFGEAKNLQSKVDQVSLMVFSASLLLFLSTFFLRRHSKVALCFSSLYLCFAVLDVFVTHAIRIRLLEVLIYTMVFVLPYILVLTGREAWRGNRDARYLLIGVALIVCGALHDILVEWRILQSIIVVPFAFMAFILGIALILANRFTRVHEEVEELAADLENKVRVRTTDLERSLNDVRELKNKQDGDYFLTAQLLEPLGGKHVRAVDGGLPPVDANYLSKQKKTFRFRHWESEIGGDLCAIHSLRLRERDVLVFFNGDAMGKSMQGAGGALIMGTIFKTIITRSEQSARMKELYPEQWLRQCYQELQSVFLAFDGRMLISMVAGIVDEDTGMLYFVNAEHPHVALLRDGRAEFISERGVLRKLGVDDPDQVFVVQTLLLQPGDILLVGSDGRDDVQIGTNKAGFAVVNEDERAFLTDVEQSDGCLDRLADRIRARGSVLDDLSLIRIAYREDAAALTEDTGIDSEDLRTAREAYARKDFAAVCAALEPLAGSLVPPAPGKVDGGRWRAVMRMLLRACIETKDLEQAARIADEYSERVPEDSQVLLWYSHVLQRVGEMRRAIDVSERLFMRDPEHSRNRQHLARLHRQHGSPERSLELEAKS